MKNKVCGMYKCPKQSVDDPKKPCGYKTDIRIEMIEHATNIHGAKFKNKFLTKVKDRSITYRRKRNFENTN